jgi:hypothetical protein
MISKIEFMMAVHHSSRPALSQISGKLCGAGTLDEIV